MNIDYINRLKDIKIKCSDENKSSNDHQILECLVCSHKWRATPKSKIQNFKKYGKIGCPKCSHLSTYSSIRNENINKIREKFEIISEFKIEDFNNSLMLTVKNLTCMHIFTSKTGNLLNRNVNCPICNTDVKKVNYKQFNEERHKNALLGKKGFSQYCLLVNKLTRETYRKFFDIINPKNLKRARSGQDGYHLDHIISKKYCFQNNIPAEICAHRDNLRLIYWKENAEKWKKPNVFFPQIFSKYVKSFDKVNNFINSISNEETKSLVSDLLSSHTLTIVNPNKKIVIQYLTLNENLEKHTGTRNYNRDLQNKIEGIGYKFIAVFEDEWDKEPNLIINKINHLLKNNSAEKIMARKCQIKSIDVSIKNKFLDVNHIQGKSVSQINLGAFYDNKLVAVMTFCKPRILMNKKIDINKKSWELARFATDINYRIIGISSKLLAYFKNNYLWDEIYSYADKRWSDGNLYYKLGFSLKTINPPDYFYIVNNKRMHRWGYRKDAIREKFPESFDPNLTEYQNMLKLGIDRVWDCGTLKFVLNKE